MEQMRFGLLKALGFSFVVAAAAYVCGGLLPVVGGPAFGIIFGIILGNLGLKPALPGNAFGKASSRLLSCSLALLGFGLSFAQVLAAGESSLWVMLFTLLLAFAAAWLMGRLLKIPYRMTALIGMGTAICGGSAISALAPIIKAKEDEVAYAVSTIFLYNLAAVFIFPPLGHLLGLSDLGFGLWAGTAVNDTSSVLATAYSFGPASGDWAAVVKLTRTTLIVPLCFIFAILTAWRESENKIRPRQIARTFPKFVIFFLLASCLTSPHLIPLSVSNALYETAKLLIIWALACVGLAADLRRMAKSGLRPFALGLCVWAAVAGGALIVQHAGGKW